MKPRLWSAGDSSQFLYVCFDIYIIKSLLSLSCYCLSMQTQCLYNFDPFSLNGNDIFHYLVFTLISLFQSRSILDISTVFGPRSHEGSDGAPAASISVIACISIHAPTKGATAILYNKFPLFHIILTNPSKILLKINYLLFIFMSFRCFISFFWCECLQKIMYTSCSHYNNQNISVSSTAIPLSTPICSIFV